MEEDRAYICIHNILSRKVAVANAYGIFIFVLFCTILWYFCNFIELNSHIQKDKLNYAIYFSAKQ